jgi:hypothetical protein
MHSSLAVLVIPGPGRRLVLDPSSFFYPSFSFLQPLTEGVQRHDHPLRSISFKRNLFTLVLSAVLPVAAFAQTMVPGQLKVGMEITYPPFRSWQGDKVVGFDPDMAEMLGRELKLKPSFVDTKFPGLILGLGGGQFDAVISGMYITPERTAQADAIAYGKAGCGHHGGQGWGRDAQD